jgi:anti-anti-sigma factor
MTPLAELLDERRGGTVVAHVRGEVDASNVAWLGSGLRGLLTNRSDALLIDLTETTYLDSAGIALLFTLAGEMRLHQQRLHVAVAPGSNVGRMLTLSGLETTVATHPGIDDALDAIAGGPATLD